MPTLETSSRSHSNTPRPRLAAYAFLALFAAAVISVLLPTAAADATQQYQQQYYYSTNPCPWFSVQNVTDDPNSDWDNDGVNNRDEFYNGLKPCVPDTATFCAGGGNPLCRYPSYAPVSSPCQISVQTTPTADYDGDGVRNSDEVRNGADPCTHPCPYPTHADLSLNPNADWDRDGVSNAVEVSRGTDPCNVRPVNPCPYWTAAHVNAAPNLDWDGDGATNANEVWAGSNPCVARVVTYTYVAPKPVYVAPPTTRLPHVTTYVAPTTTTRLPHVTTYVAPTRPACPHGYPYYHPGNGKCYANPVGNHW